MAKFYLNNLPEKARISLIADFYDMMSCVKNRDEIRTFFRDILSPDEMAMLTRRMNVAILLMKGFTFEEIKDSLKVGADKITSVHRSLERHGEGYKMVAERLEQMKKTRNKTRKMPTNDWEMLKNKYPGYFLFSNLFERISTLLKEKKEKAMKSRKNNKPYPRK